MSIISAPATPAVILPAKVVDGVRLDLHATNCGPDCGEVEKCDLCAGPMCFMHDDEHPIRGPVEWLTSSGYLGGYNHRGCALT